MRRLLAGLFFVALSMNLNAQPCPVSTFHNTYRLANGDEEVSSEDALITTGDILYTVGITQLFKNSSSFGGIQKYDNTGALLWHKAYVSGHESTDSWTEFRQVISASDNNLMVSGIASADFYTSYPIFQKTDLDGNPIWAKVFPQFNQYTPMAVTALPDGGFAYAFGPLMVGKLDKNGVPVWTKSFHTAGSVPDANSAGNIIYGDGAVYVTFGIGGGGSYRSAHLLKLDPDNGSEIWEKKVSGSTFSINFSQIYCRDKMLYMPYEYVPSQYTNNFGSDRTKGRIKMDENGNVQDIIQFDLPFAGLIWMKFFKNDAFVASLYNYTQNKIGLIRIPAEGYIEWAHDYTVPAYEIGIASIAQLSSGSYLAVSNYWLSTDYAISTWLTMVNNAGQMSNCPTQDNTAVGITHVSLPFTDDNLQSSDLIPNIQPYHLTITNQSPVSAAVCSGQDLCSSLIVAAHSDVCTSGETVTFTADRGNACTLAVDWTYDTSAATVVSAGPSSIDLVFHKSGAFQLTGTLKTSCRLLTGNTTLNVYESPNGLDLGPDRVLCQGALDTLHAGKGFMTYSWQDGSTDSVYHVSAPGNYSVTATTYCNKQFSDAIQLIPPETVDFHLGPDITICPGDTTTIIPPVGFSDYSWYPAYNELKAALPSLRVYPDQDTTYTCTALTTQRCPVAADVRVQLVKVPGIDGRAFNICPGKEVILDAGGGFISYSWTTGEITRQITVSQPARYSVEAGNSSNSCISRGSDTVSWYKVQKPTLDPNVALCTDSSHLFYAGKGYINYVWQDGSTNAAFAASLPGEYWVQVTDSNGCSAGDTVEIIGKGHCFIGIHFPNAFTPNGDGKNETFRPIFSGSLDAYHLAIFDRYGELVFETNDPQKGWDGRYKGTSRSTSTFVWYATYHFSGSPEPATMQKGTLEVIR